MHQCCGLYQILFSHFSWSLSQTRQAVFFRRRWTMITRFPSRSQTWCVSRPSSRASARPAGSSSWSSASGCTATARRGTASAAATPASAKVSPASLNLTSLLALVLHDWFYSVFPYNDLKTHKLKHQKVSHSNLIIMNPWAFIKEAWPVSSKTEKFHLIF